MRLDDLGAGPGDEVAPHEHLVVKGQATEQQGTGGLFGCQGDLGPAGGEVGKMSRLDDLPVEVGCANEGNEDLGADRIGEVQLAGEGV